MKSHGAFFSKLQRLQIRPIQVIIDKTNFSEMQRVQITIDIDLNKIIHALQVIQLYGKISTVKVNKVHSEQKW